LKGAGCSGALQAAYTPERPETHNEPAAGMQLRYAMPEEYTAAIEDAQVRKRCRCAGRQSGAVHEEAKRRTTLNRHPGATQKTRGMFYISQSISILSIMMSYFCYIRAAFSGASPIFLLFFLFSTVFLMIKIYFILFSAASLMRWMLLYFARKFSRSRSDDIRDIVFSFERYEDVDILSAVYGEFSRHARMLSYLLR
jgi:hypothetical protein